MRNTLESRDRTRQNSPIGQYVHLNTCISNEPRATRADIGYDDTRQSGDELGHWPSHAVQGIDGKGRVLTRLHQIRRGRRQEDQVVSG